MCLGSLRDVSLATARDLASQMRKKVLAGTHPKAEQVRLKMVAAQQESVFLASNTVCMDDIVEKALTHHQRLRRLKTKHYLQTYLSIYNRFVSPHVGKIPLMRLTRGDVAETLTPIWDSRPQISAKALATMRACFAYAQAFQLFEGTPPTTWEAGLNALLPKLNIKSREHRKSLDWKLMPDFYAALSKEFHTPTVRGLLIVVLCCLRESEARLLRTEDIDFGRKVFLVRNRKDKNPEPFVVPYPTQLELILRQAVGIPYATASRTPLYPAQMVRWMNRQPFGKNITVHGFRASFSTWCAENGKDPILREKCLCHKTESEVAAAYQRSSLLEQRRVLLQEWADYVTSQSAS